jgi:hypothetical protein
MLPRTAVDAAERGVKKFLRFPAQLTEKSRFRRENPRESKQNQPSILRVFALKPREAKTIQTELSVYNIYITL